MPREDFSVPITGALTGWGWNSYFEAFWQCGGWKTAVPARVIAQQRKFWCVAGEFGERSAEASGKLRLAADEGADRSEEHTSELQSQSNLVCRLLLEKKKKEKERHHI